jgi:protein-disulfide isomerase
MTTRAFPGKVRVVYKHFPLTFHKNAMLAHAAAAAAHAQGKFWELHDRIFEERKVGREDLIRMARVSGVDVDRFILDMDGGKYTTSIQADRAAGEAAGVVATPTILINGKKYEGAKTADELVALVGREIAATVPDAQPVAESTSATYYRGEADAPITIESFLDMQSSLLGRAKELLEQVEHGFRGQVKVVVRHRPLPGRDLSFAAHEALLAAGAQGKFWQYLELLAERNGAIGEADLVAFAVKLELDQLRFRRDLDQHTFRPDVQRDLEMARKADIRGTPTFLIDGKRIDGLQPMTIFDGLIQGAIRSKEDKAR